MVSITINSIDVESRSEIIPHEVTIFGLSKEEWGNIKGNIDKKHPDWKEMMVGGVKINVVRRCVSKGAMK